MRLCRGMAPETQFSYSADMVMTRPRSSRTGLALALMVAVLSARASAGQGGAKSKKLPAVPSTCGCSEKGFRLMARAPFSAQAPERLLYAPLSPAPDRRFARLEPWLMELIVGRDGEPCSLSVVRGENVPLIAAMQAAVAHWRFRPFIGNSGGIKGVCDSHIPDMWGVPRFEGF